VRIKRVYFYSKRILANILDENDTGDPDETWDVVCFNVETITKRWANEISWSVGPCLSNGKDTCTANAGYFNNMNFTQLCCVAPADYKITCNDCYGDGWKGGYLLINGIKYCDNFTGMKHEVDITVSNPEGKRLRMYY
jgi:hypothetical protein